MSSRPVPKTPPPLLGFNNNVKHRGRVFHIQTEDSGVKRPHVITHLFADGGRIVKSKKTTYTEHVGREDTPQVVRRLMKDQHKAMFIALRGGEFDELIEGICGPHPLPAPTPKAVEPPPSSPEAAPPSKERPKRLSNPNLQRVDPEQARALARQVAQRELDIDVDSHLKRPEPQVKNTPVHGTPVAAEPKADEAGRYAASRPAAIFESRPDEGSIFGGGISEQSLDDVILSYIAEDLDEG
ncbi:MAG: hypothetical protein R3B89_10875 [Polyangiaceae bacterium]